MTSQSHAQPPKDADPELKDIWLLWFALNYLDEKARAGEPYVAAKELRQAVIDKIAVGETNREEKRDNVLHSLDTVKAVRKTNLEGYRSRRYFLTAEFGHILLEQYDQFLKKNIK